MREFDIAAEGWGSVTVETAGLAEGRHGVRADLVYNGNVVEGFRESTFIVDHALPEARITYPSLSAGFCAAKVESASGKTLRVVRVEGVAKDENNLRGYSLVYGEGTNPQAWYDAGSGLACDPDGEGCPFHSAGDTAGELGQWNVTNLVPGEYTLRLMATDSFGNHLLFFDKGRSQTDQHRPGRDR
ncbi:MAG: hypothetical protein Kow0089_03310 [Desulfobulbaceae bacterium]